MIHGFFGLDTFWDEGRDALEPAARELVEALRSNPSRNDVIDGVLGGLDGLADPVQPVDGRIGRHPERADGGIRCARIWPPDVAATRWRSAQVLR